MTTRFQAHDDQLEKLDFDSLEATVSDPMGMPFVRVFPEHGRTGAPADVDDAIETDPSWAIQASALALSTTFAIVTPPVGIAMFAYAALRQSTAMDLLPRQFEFPGTDAYRAGEALQHQGQIAGYG